MRKADCSMWICLKRKNITLNNPTIVALGKPSRLNIWYEDDSYLIFTPAQDNDIDAYEIPPYFWKRPNPALVISQMSFLYALQYRLHFEKNSRYFFPGNQVKTAELPAVVFNLTGGEKLQ